MSVVNQIRAYKHRIFWFPSPPPPARASAGNTHPGAVVCHSKSTRPACRGVPCHTWTVGRPPWRFGGKRGPPVPPAARSGRLPGMGRPPIVGPSALLRLPLSRPRPPRPLAGSRIDADKPSTPAARPLRRYHRGVRPAQASGTASFPAPGVAGMAWGSAQLLSAPVAAFVAGPKRRHRLVVTPFRSIIF